MDASVYHTKYITWWATATTTVRYYHSHNYEERFGLVMVIVGVKLGSFASLSCWSAMMQTLLFEAKTYSDIQMPLRRNVLFIEIHHH